MSLRDQTSKAQARPADNLRGAALLVLAMLALTLEAAAIRWVGPSASVSQAVFFRAMAQLLVVCCWSLWRGGLPDLRTGRPWLHVARGAGSVSSWWLYYYTFRHLDFALATILTFATSLFVVLLARPILGEKVRLGSWVATLIGFGGVALASGVGTVGVDPTVAVGLSAALIGSLVVFLNRTLSQSEDMLTIFTYICFFVVAAAIPMAWYDWQPISLAQTAILLGAGLLGALGMLLTIEAYGRGETSVLAPIPFVRIVFAMAFAYLLFAETPTLNMVVGAVVVVGAALAVAAGERRPPR
ncbi:MAG TPA: DMT family transporter [Beijerinckiaceae bacterium]|nr:DMT family transporter [Beijerinckiaceae bacterium]